jgi:hypothetical protein
MRTAAFELAQEPTDTRIFSKQPAPASEEASLTRPHSFASPARTARTNERNRNRFPGLRGDGQAELAPPNLRYISE